MTGACIMNQPECDDCSMQKESGRCNDRGMQKLVSLCHDQGIQNESGS